MLDKTRDWQSLYRDEIGEHLARLLTLPDLPQLQFNNAALLCLKAKQ